jgi:hypothetical protein
MPYQTFRLYSALFLYFYHGARERNRTSTTEIASPSDLCVYHFTTRALPFLLSFRYVVVPPAPLLCAQLFGTIRTEVHVSRSELVNLRVDLESIVVEAVATASRLPERQHVDSLNVIAVEVVFNRLRFIWRGRIFKQVHLHIGLVANGHESNVLSVRYERTRDTDLAPSYILVGREGLEPPALFTVLIYSQVASSISPNVP